MDPSASVASSSSGLSSFFSNAAQANLESAEKHHLANKVTKLRHTEFSKLQPDERCDCCLFPVSGKGAQPFKLSELNEFAELGLAFPLYFHLNRYLTAMLAIITVVAAIPATFQNEYMTTDSNSIVLHMAIGDKYQDMPTWPVALHTVAIILLCFAYIITSLRLKGLVNVLGEGVVTPSDYAVMLKNLGKDWTSADLKKHIEENMKVEGQEMKVALINVAYEVSEYVAIMKNIQKFKQRMDDYQAQQLNKPSPYSFCKCLRSKSNFHTELIPDEEIQAGMVVLENEIATISKGELQKTGVAIVIFETIPQAKLFFNTWKRGIIRRFVCCCLSAFDYQLDFAGTKMYIKKAPEPNDIAWTNLKYARLKRMLTQVGTLLVVAGILVVSYFSLDYLATLQQNLKDKMSDQTFSSLSSTPIAAVILVISIIINFVSRLMSSLEHHHSYTAENLFVSWKLTVLLTLNSMLFPLLVHKTTNGWYIPDGLAPNIFYIVIAAAFVKPFMKMLSPLQVIAFVRRLILRYQLRKGTSFITQEKANQQFQDPEVDIALWYADLLSKFMLTLAYTSMIPIIAPIMLVGLGVDYWVNKVTLIKLSSRPKLLNERIARSMLGFAKMGIAFYGIGVYVFFNTTWKHNHDDDDSDTSPDSVHTTSVVALIIGCAFFLIPVSLFRCCFRFVLPPRKIKPARPYSEESKFFFVVLLHTEIRVFQPCDSRPSTACTAPSRNSNLGHESRHRSREHCV